MCDFRVEKGEGFGWLDNAASHQQLGQHLRQAGGFGQLGGLGRMRLREAPALAKELPLFPLPRNGRPGLRGARLLNCPVAFSAHCAYSSSSSCS